MAPEATAEEPTVTFERLFPRNLEIGSHIFSPLTTPGPAPPGGGTFFHRAVDIVLAGQSCSSVIPGQVASGTIKPCRFVTLQAASLDKVG